MVIKLTLIKHEFLNNQRARRVIIITFTDIILNGVGSPGDKREFKQTTMFSDGDGMALLKRFNEPEQWLCTCVINFGPENANQFRI